VHIDTKPAQLTPTEVSPKRLSSTTEDESAKDKDKESPADVPLDTRTRIQVGRDSVRLIWDRIKTPSSLEMVWNLIITFQASIGSIINFVIQLMVWTTVLTPMFSLPLRTACYIRWFPSATICHATQTSSLCAIPYSYNLLVYCPSPPSSMPAHLNASEFSDVPNGFTRLLNVREQAANLPFAFSNMRIQIDEYSEQVRSSNFFLGKQLRVAIDEFNNKALPAANHLRIFTHQCLAVTKDIHYTTEAVRETLEKHLSHRRFRYILYLIYAA
jgi:hypothetical protein